MHYYLCKEEEEELDLKDEIGRATSTLSETTGARLVLRLDDVRIVGQRHRVSYVLHCLIANALEAARRTAGEARVVLQHKDGRAVIVISDTGPGIRGDDIERVAFGDTSYVQIFYKKGATPGQRNPPGWLKSFGLILSQAITEQMGGTFEFTSEEGVGTTVTLTLPYAWGIDRSRHDDSRFDDDESR